MAGHWRKRSSSTVTSVNNSRPTLWVQEETLLKPLPDQVLLDVGKSDDWPSFVLTEATVYSAKDGKRLANPLLPVGPFIVRGKLEVDLKEKKERDQLVDRKVSSGYIEIRNVTQYSIGYTEKCAQIWITGRSGWFELQPSPEYTGIFGDIQEATALYYEILSVFEQLKSEIDEYNNMPKSQKKRFREPTVDLDQMLLKYAVGVGNGMFRDEAEQVCHKWAQFLISHFHKEVNFEWKGTFFYTWLIDKHPTFYKQHLKRVAAEQKSVNRSSPPVSTIQPPSRASSSQSQGQGTRSNRQSLDIDVEMKDASSFLAASSPAARARPRSLSRKISSSPAPAAKPQAPAVPQTVAATAQTAPSAVQPAEQVLQSVANASEVPSPLDTLLQALEEISVGRKPSKISKKTVQAQLYYAYRMSKYEAPAEILAYFCKELVSRLDHKWRETPFWDWLLSQSRQPPIALQHTTLDRLPHYLLKRERKEATRETRTPTGAASQLPSRPKLMPKSRQQSNDVNSDDDGISSLHPRHAGKGGLRLQSASKKRTAADMLGDSDTTGSGRRWARKAAKTTHYYNLEDFADTSAASDLASPPADMDNEEDEEEDLDEDDPDLLLADPPRDAVRIVVHAEKLPSMSPSGPNGTWVCDQPECGYVVRAAEEPPGRKLVQQHYSDHEAQTRMTALALDEAERRGRMPINNLLERIQRIGRASLSKGQEEINGEQVPLPIKRRLIV